jgi:SWIM zinc finger
VLKNSSYYLFMALTLERIEALAPDQPSLAAARKLLKPASWPTLAAAEDIVWGECQGSGATPYRVVISETDDGYKCTCPSRKFPCKHSLALMWMRTEAKVPFASPPMPEWVKDWRSRRRGTSSITGKPVAEGEPKPKPSIRLAEETEQNTSTDPKAEARAAAARERNRLDREASILAGLDDLDVWLDDQVDRGIATFVAQSTQACRLIAQRLFDAKAPGLATRLEGLAARLFTLPEAIRPVAAVQELGQVYLMSEAYRRQGELPAPLIADARQATGWSVAREALIDDESALHVTAVWRVVTVLSEVQADRLRRVETWLWRENNQEVTPRFAALIDFVPIATGAASSGYTVGDRIEAELVFYPSTLPLRAQIVRILSGAQHSASALELPQADLNTAFGAFEHALGQLPWLGTWPLAFRNAQVRRTDESLFLCDAENTFALPLHSSQASLARPLTSVGMLEGIALWNGYHLTLCWAQTELGRWVNA